MTTQNKNKLVVNTYCPIFSGFYETWFNDEADYIEDTNGINIASALHANDYIDWSSYHIDISKGVVSELECKLKELGVIEAMEYQELISPREYNFANDIINVSVTLDTDNKEAIKNYIYDNMEAFSKYIKKTYTCYDGFISYHEDNHNVWISQLASCLEHEHKLGSILDFILINEDSEAEYNLACYIKENISVESYINKEVIAYDKGYYFSINEPLQIVHTDNEYIYVINTED